MPARILVCDDAWAIQRAVSFKLTRAGFEVETASDGVEALEAIRRHRPDVLITDCQMPRMDGFQLIEHLRSVPETATLPIFLLTARGFEFDHEQIKNQWQVCEVLAKPFSPRELVELIDRALKESASGTNGSNHALNGKVAQETLQLRSPAVDRL